jgi:putative hydrolase of the HAD superfamily
MESDSPLPTRLLPRQTLLFDADDTLWENNIYFERAIAAFITYLDHRVHSAEEVRDHLNSVERATISQHGYGMKSFRRSLIACFEQLTDAPLTEEKHNRIVSFAESIAEQEIELLPGVPATLQQLAERHELHMVTKGDLAEQNDKLDRSGLRPWFTEVEILAEKTADAYRGLADQHGFNPDTTWMIGNSPRSDINPSLAAGLNAIFIPHDFTWVLEHEVLDPAPTGRTLLELSSFTDLLTHF